MRSWGVKSYDWRIQVLLFPQSWSCKTPPIPHPVLSDLTPHQTLPAMQMSSWNLEVTSIECLASLTIATNHSEQVPSKLPSRYSCMVPQTPLSIHPHQPLPHYWPHADLEPPWAAASCQHSRTKMTKATHCFCLFFPALLQVYQPGEDKSDISLSHIFWNKPSTFLCQSLLEHDTLLFSWVPNPILSLNGRSVSFAIL